jgi:cell division transport system permease protein
MKSTDIYFAGDDAHAFLPWIIGIMASMATLLLCLGITVGSWVIDHSDDYINSFTVNVPSSAENLSDQLPKFLDVLQKTPGVTNVKQVSEEKMRDMLKPWLGSGVETDALPLPFVFDVTISGNSKLNYKELQTKLHGMIEGTVVDSHEAWVANFVHFSSAVRSVMSGLAILIIGGLALMIAFTSRASLKLHARTVNLLHSIGAEDGYIMRQFQREAMMVTLRGTLPGCIIAGAAYWGAGLYMETLQSPVIPSFVMHVSHIVLLITMPIACGAVAVIAARISVFKQLQRVL